MFTLDKFKLVNNRSKEVKVIDLQKYIQSKKTSPNFIDFIDGQIVVNEVDLKTAEEQEEIYNKLKQEHDSRCCTNCLSYSGNHFCNQYEYEIYDTTIYALDCKEFINLKDFT